MHQLPPPSAEVLPPAALAVEGTPFERQWVTLSKQEYIQLKSDIGYWKAQHRQSIAREKTLHNELEKARGEIHDLRQRLYGRKSEKAFTRDDSRFVDGPSSRPRGQQPGSQGHGRCCREPRWAPRCGPRYCWINSYIHARPTDYCNSMPVLICRFLKGPSRTDSSDSRRYSSHYFRRCMRSR